MRNIITMVFIAFILYTSITFSAIVGLKTETDCVNYAGKPEKTGELALCYHEVAISYASFKNGFAAEQYCDKILTLAILSPGFINKDIARSQAYLCYADIAHILQDPTKCVMIDEGEDKFNLLVAGASTTKEICEQNASKKKQKPYCGVALFILLPLLFAVAEL